MYWSCWYWHHDFWFFGQLGNMKHRCANHIVNVPNVLTQSNVEIILKGICFSISQTTFSTNSFYVFFFSKSCSNPFLVVTNTFILFYRLFWTLTIFHGRKRFSITITMKNTNYVYLLTAWIFSQHPLFPLHGISLFNSNYTCKLHFVFHRHVDLSPLLSAFWYSLCNFWIELLYQGLFHYQ